MIIIKEWVRNIFMIVIAISFVEIILPSGKMKKYLQFIFSTVMLAVMIRPLAELPTQDAVVNAFSVKSFLQETEKTGSDFTQKYTGYTIDITGIYQDKIKERITAIVEADFQGTEVLSIETAVDERPVEQGGGYVKAIYITLSGSFDREEMQGRLAEEIGIAKNAITIDAKK